MNQCSRSDAGASRVTRGAVRGRGRVRHDAGLNRRRRQAQVGPRDVLHRSGRACASTLGASVTQVALAGLAGRRVDGDDRPRAGLRADAAADAQLLVDLAGAGLAVGPDGALRARLCTGNGVRTLLAGVDLHAEVSGLAFGHSGLGTLRGAEVPGDLDAGEVRAGSAVVELAARELAAPASDAAGDLVEQDALGVRHDGRLERGGERYAAEHGDGEHAGARDAGDLDEVAATDPSSRGIGAGVIADL